MFTVVWFTVSGKCQQSNSPSMGEWINSMVYPYYGLLRKGESVKSLTPVQLFMTPWTVAHQLPLSMGFSRQGYWSGLPCPPPRDLPDPGIEAGSPASPALQTDLFTSCATREIPIQPSKGKSLDTGYNVNEPWGQDATWCKPDRKRNIAWFLICEALRAGTYISRVGLGG